MAEIEIKTEGGESDPLGQKVGVLAAVLAVCLAVVSIQSHRAHTTAVVERSEANDQWSLYQSNRIKFHSLELGVDLMNVLGRDKPDAEQTIARYETQQKKYEKESKEVKDEATKKGAGNPPHRRSSSPLRPGRRDARNRRGAWRRCTSFRARSYSRWSA